MRMSQTLKLAGSGDARSVTCSQCDYAIGPAGQAWKPHATLQEGPIRDMGGPYTAGEQVLLRNFTCPQCGTLLDTEIALAEDPFLDDIIFE